MHSLPAYRVASLSPHPHLMHGLRSRHLLQCHESFPRLTIRSPRAWLIVRCHRLMHGLPYGVDTSCTAYGVDFPCSLCHFNDMRCPLVHGLQSRRLVHGLRCQPLVLVVSPCVCRPLVLVGLWIPRRIRGGCGDDQDDSTRHSRHDDQLNPQPRSPHCGGPQPPP